MNLATCPRCHAPIPADGPLGLCPQCVLALGMNDAELIATGAGEPLPPPPTREDIQPLFPHLEIIGLIGRGGMGAVYEARQRGLNRRVALKLLWAPSIPDAGFEQRFAREGRALAQLSHPNVVAVHDAGRSGPYYWLVMEYVDGPNLRALLQQGPIEAPRALTIVMQMCAALDYAHKRGIVHRDIKPENVLVTREGRVKIADFGLAKVLARHHHSPAITRSEQAMGTPHYIAPEQIERPKEVDHRADIYSLGVVLYETLTGELPLGRFQLPSRKAEVDSRVDEIVVKAMQKQPERRYQAASEVNLALKHVSEQPVPRPRSAQRARRKQVPWPMIAAASVVLLATGLLANRLGILRAGSREADLTPEQHYARGRALVVRPDRLEDGLVELEAAYAEAPELDGLRALLSQSMSNGIERLKSERRYDEAVLLARRASAVDPSNDEAARSVEELARAEWARIVVIDHPAEGQVLSGGPFLVRGHVLGMPEGTRLTIGGVEVPVVVGTFKHSVEALPDGEQVVLLSVTTPSKLTIPLPRHFTIDTEKPRLAVSAPARGDIVGASFTIRGKVTDTSKTTVAVDGQPAVVEGGTWSLDLDREEGAQDLVVIATDEQGLETSATVPVVVDATPPRIEPPEQGFSFVLSLRDPAIVVHVADDHRIKTATWNGRPVEVDGDGNVRLSCEVAEEGVDVERVLEVTDEAGNPAEQPIVLRRDDTKPVLGPAPESEPVFPDSTYVMKGTFTDRSHCVLEMDGKRTELGDGEFAVRKRIDPDRRPGEKFVVTFRLCDEAGNCVPGERVVEVIPPCLACKQVDGLRGDCVPCQGKGQRELTCPDCRGGQASDDCKVCGGTGKADCPTCQGSRTGQGRDCLSCDEGVATCDDCQGSGRMVIDCNARECNGGRVYPVGDVKGRGRRGQPCNTCHGSGKREVDCDQCNGNGRNYCKECTGGQVYPECPDCHGTGRSKEKCNACGGQAKQRGTCSTCSGSGKRMRDCTPCRGSGNCKECDGSGRADSGGRKSLVPEIPRPR